MNEDWSSRTAVAVEQLDRRGGRSGGAAGAVGAAGGVETAGAMGQLEWVGQLKWWDS